MRKSSLWPLLISLPLLISGAVWVTDNSRVAFAQANEKPSTPNIIFLLTDDQRWDALGYAGNKIIQTPQMDWMAREGIYFKNAYVTTSICAVSRASILSGQYARRHGIQDFSTSFSAEAFTETYPALLRQAGYHTGFIGKYGVGSEMPTDQFDEWYGFPGQGTFHHKDNQGQYQHLTSLMGESGVGFFFSNETKNSPFAFPLASRRRM